MQENKKMGFWKRLDFWLYLILGMMAILTIIFNWVLPPILERIPTTLTKFVREPASDTSAIVSAFPDYKVVTTGFPAQKERKWREPLLMSEGQYTLARIEELLGSKKYSSPLILKKETGDPSSLNDLVTFGEGEVISGIVVEFPDGSLLRIWYGLSEKYRFPKGQKIKLKAYRCVTMPGWQNSKYFVAE